MHTITHGPNAGTETTVYHGNYQCCKSNENVLTYVTKEGNYVATKSYEELMLLNRARKNHNSIIGEWILQEKKITTEMI